MQTVPTVKIQIPLVDQAGERGIDIRPCSGQCQARAVIGAGTDRGSARRRDVQRAVAHSKHCAHAGSARINIIDADGVDAGESQG